MELLQRTYETYHNNEHLAGVIREGHEPLSPVSHQTKAPDVEITVDVEGEFVQAFAYEKKVPEKKKGKATKKATEKPTKSYTKIIIPVTEDSDARTNEKQPLPHPLCDQLWYMLPENKEKFHAYTSQLSDWANSDYSHPKLMPILTYVLKGTILEDLIRSKIIKQEDVGKEKVNKLFICWNVVGLGEGMDGPCGKDREMFRLFTEYYKWLHRDDKKVLCAITGEYTMPIYKHQRGIVPMYGTAKLISLNKSFMLDERQGVTIGYDASCKIHNTLKWLVNENGVRFGGRMFICWNPKGKELPKIAAPLCRDVPKGQAEPLSYRKELFKALTGFKNRLRDEDNICIASFDSAVPGRLAVTDYNEISAKDFLDSLYEWDATCCFPCRYGSWSPSLVKIANYVFGTPRKENGGATVKADSGAVDRWIQDLVKCRILGLPIPCEVVDGISRNTSMLSRYNRSVRMDLVSTACAVLRKYYYDWWKEEYEMSLEMDKKDRSYQFGRLLAVYERIESYCYHIRKIVDREPYAMRVQNTYINSPLQTAMEIDAHVSLCCFHDFTKKGRDYYKKIISEIMGKIQEFPEDEWNMPLDPSYLMGYYLQRDYMFEQAMEAKRKNGESQSSNENETEYEYEEGGIEDEGME